MKRIITRYLLIMIFAPFINVYGQTSTYIFTGSVQIYTVGLGVTSLGIDVRGAQGGTYPGFGGAGGMGGRVQCTLAVTPGELLYVYVGQQGPDGGTGSVPPGGSNSGGGAQGGAGSSSIGGGSGGGSSDIRTTSGLTFAALSSRLVVGGAGGGGAWDCGGDLGGAGGNTTGGLGTDCGGYSAYYEGTPGTPASGGLPGAYGYATAGGFGYGGDADWGYFGGGGGGGWYGAGGAYSGGGCGGSSYAGTGTSGVTYTSGYQTGDGQVIITVLCTTPVAGTIVGAASVCEGSTTTFTDPTGTAGGVWTSSNSAVASVGSSSGIVYGVTAGSAIITYTIALSCGTATATRTIAVNPLPAGITGPNNVCAGSAITLGDATAFGAWSSTNSGVATVNVGTGSVLGLTAGTTVISYTLSTGCGVAYPVTVNPVPAPIAGPTGVCQGLSITLTDAATGGTWSSSSTAIAAIGASTGVLNGLSPGTAVITYNNGCGTPATVTVTVKPVPAAITGTTSICQGATSLLSDATSGGTWSSITMAVATIGSATGLATGAAAGTSVISYTLANGCAATTTVNVIPPLAPIVGAPKLCTGLTTTLTATPAGGVWTSSSVSLATVGSASGVVTGVSMGAVQITYTAGAGCSAIHYMTINPLAPIAGSDSVCVGLNTYLTNIVGGGIWSSGSSSIATVTSDSGRVFGLVPGTTVITYLLPTGCSASVNFRVIDFPTPSTGLTKACPGTTVTLSNATPGGTWTTGNSEVATVGGTSGVVTGVAADTVSIRYTILPGCTVSTLVTINLLPEPITGGKTICPGFTDTLHDLTPRGLWSTATASIATVVDTSGVVIAVSGGAAIISYTLPTGCARTKSVSVNPAPAPNVTYQWWINSFYADPGFVTYQWYDSIMGLIPGATSEHLAATQTEYYYVVVTDSNGCIGTSAHIHYSAEMVRVGNVTMSQARIYPNPTDGMVYIESSENVRAVVSGLDGKKLLEKTDAKTIDLGSLADGVYFIGLYDANGQIVLLQKVVKQ